MTAAVAAVRRLADLLAASALVMPRLTPLVVTLVAARRASTGVVGQLSLVMVVVALAAAVADWGGTQWAVAAGLSRQQLLNTCAARLRPAAACAIAAPFLCGAVAGLSLIERVSVSGAVLASALQGAAFFSYGRRGRASTTLLLAAMEHLPAVLLVSIWQGSLIVGLCVGRAMGAALSFLAILLSQYTDDHSGNTQLTLRDFGRYSGLLVVAAAIANYGDTLALGLTSNAHALGVYRYALTVVAPLSVVATISAAPLQRHFASGKPGRMRSSAVSPACLALLGVGVAMAVGVFALRNSLLNAIAGHPVPSAGSTIALLLTANTVGMATQPMTSFILATEGSMFLSRVGLFTSVLVLVASLIGSALGPFAFAAIGPLLGYIVGFNAQVRHVRRSTDAAAKTAGSSRAVDVTAWEYQ